MALRVRLRYLYDLIAVLVRKELKLRYRGTMLGILWSLANPLAFAFVLHVAFKRVLDLAIEDYAVFILAALFPWQWFTNSLGQGTNAFVTSSALIKKLPFPRIALCFAVVFGDLIHFLVTIPVLLGLVLATREGFAADAWLVGLPLLVLVQAVHTLALVTFVASANAFLRDLEQLVNVLLLLLFYVTPIIFPVSMVPESLEFMLVLNPMAPLMISWRTLVMESTVSPYLALAALHALLALVVAVPLYRRLAPRLAEVV